jgi:hypothetical protein
MAKTAQEKAQADLDVAERKYKRASEKLEAHKAAAVTLEAEVQSLGEHVDYLKQHPALKSLEDAVAEAQANKVEKATDVETPDDNRQEAFADF